MSKSISEVDIKPLDFRALDVSKEYPRLKKYLDKTPLDINNYHEHLLTLKFNPTKCYTLKEGLRYYGDQQQLEISPEICTHTNLFPLTKGSDGKWTGDNIPKTFIVHPHMYIPFLCSIVGDWARPNLGIIHSIQEPIRSDDNVRLFMDLDSDGIYITKEYIDKIVETFLGVIQYYFEASHIKLDEIIVLRNNSSPKTKVHVHIPCIILKKTDLKFIATKVKSLLPLLADIIDINYSGCRMALTKKRDKSMSIYYDTHYPPYGAQYPEEQLILLMKTKVLAFPWEESINRKEEYLEIRTSRNLKYNDEGDEVVEITSELRNTMDKYIPDGQFRAEWKEWGYNLKRMAPGHCVVCNKDHENDNAQIRLSGSNIVYHCWRNSGKKHILEKYRELTEEEIEIMNENKALKVAKLLTYDPPYFVKKEVINEEYLTELSLDKKRQIICSPKNTGKTTQMIKFIKAGMMSGEIKSMAWLSTRIKYARSIKSVLEASNIPVTLYLGNNIANDPFVIVGMESIHLLTRDYDLVVIDEVTSVLKQMDSGLHKGNLFINRLSLETCIRMSKYLIALDADIDERAVTFIRHFFPTEWIHMTHNIVLKRCGAKIVEHYGNKGSKATWLEKIKCALDSNKNIVICSGSELKINELVMPFLLNKCGISEHKIRYYHGSGDDYDYDFNDVNKEWVRYRVVIYTSTINVGVDFHVKHFHQLFVYSTNNSNGPREIDQMMARVRNFIDDTVHLSIMAKKSFKETEYKNIKRDINTSLNLCNKELIAYNVNDYNNFKLGLGTPKHVKYKEKYKYVIDNNIWNWLTVMNIQEDNMSQVYHSEIFKFMMLKQGYIYSNEEIEPSEEYGFDFLFNFVNPQRQIYKDNIESNYNDILKMELTDDIIKQCDTNKIKGQASETDKIILKVNSFKKHFDPTIQPLIEGKHIRDINPQWIRNYQLLRDYSVKDLAKSDMKRIDNGAIDNWDLLRITNLHTISNLLGVKLDDYTTEIKRDLIERDMEVWVDLYPKFKAAFNLTRSHKIPEKPEDVIRILNSILYKSLGIKVLRKTLSRNRVGEDRKREYLYTLGNNHIDTSIIHKSIIYQSPPSPLIEDHTYVSTPKDEIVSQEIT